MLRFPVVYFQWCIFVLLRSLKRKDLILRPSRNIDQSPNIARVKIFIYARPCVNKMTCSSVFFVPFPKYPKIDGNDKKLSRLFLEFSFVLATQSNSKSGEDVSQIIEPEWFVEKSAVKTDIYLEKDHKLVKNFLFYWRNRCSTGRSCSKADQRLTQVSFSYVKKHFFG